MTGKLKLLVVDANTDDRVIVQEAVRKAGLGVDLVFAQNGKEGVDKANELKPACIAVLDTILSDMDGFELCRKIKEIDENLKVVIYTGIVDAVDASKARTAGADDFCVKTTDGAPLINALKGLMEP
ncbi:MAG: response regulator [Candidatus Omnitrophica bacterium]|nr:response regulator [Candidatus Omnitrophota bacterium]